MTRDESTTVDSALSKSETSFGKYELLERLGRGGMADVWKARMNGPHGFARMVVLKRILPHLIADKKARELFEREARVVSRLSHPHIVPVFEFGEVNGEYYLAMEYVNGRDLAAIVRAGGGTPSAASMIIRDIARALAYGYGVLGDDGAPLRVLHRDVSPSNIMVGYDGSVRLLDFGIAKALSDPRDVRTAKGIIRGKFGYLAPEIIESKSADARADLFSLGVVLHEMLTGTRLFRGGSDIETLTLVRRGPIPPPSSLNPLVPEALDRITLKALDRDRDQRYSTGDEMADALDDVAHGFRFGPAQLADLMQRLFLGHASDFGETDSHTIVDPDGLRVVAQPMKPIDFTPGGALGNPVPRHGDAVQFDEEQQTIPSRRLVAAGAESAPAASSRDPLPTVVNTPDEAARREPAPTVVNVAGSGAARLPASTVVSVSGAGAARLPASTVVSAPLPPRTTPRGPSALAIVLTGVLVGGIVVAAAFIGREMGRAKRAHDAPASRPLR